MKILFLTDYYPPYYKGGYELRCRDVAEQLSQRGHTTFILTTSYGIDGKKTEGNIFRLLDCFGWDIISRYRISFYAHLKRALLLRNNYRITLKMLKRIMPDIVYIGQLYGSSILPVFALQKQGIPYVFDIEDYWLIECKNYYSVKNNFLRRLLRYIITGVWNLDKLQFNNMCFISNRLKEKYMTAGFQNANFRVINKGIDSALHDDVIHHYRDSSRIKLLYAGRLAEEKGVHVAIESIAVLVDKEKGRKVFLDIIGTGEEDYIEKLKKVVMSKNLERAVVFMGKCSQGELLQSFRKYDALLLPSIWEEPSGGIIVEAMAHGLPVIASRIGGIPEFIKDGVTGILVSPGNAGEMAQAIARLVEDPSSYEQMSIRGMREVQQQYSHKRIAGQIDDYLHAVVTQRDT